MSEIPFGYCQCGCGEKTSIAKYNVRTRGYVKGQPLRFIRGHGAHAPGVTHRNPKALQFTEEQLAEMERLYRMGFSTLEIAERFGCLGGSIHTRLVERGVEMRPASTKRGGLSIHSNGYIKWAGRYVHRIVAEAWYGRRIRSDEHVHHIDGDRTNNHPDNLRIMPAREHHKHHFAERELDERGRLLPKAAG